MRKRPTTWRQEIAVLAGAAVLSQALPAAAQDSADATVLGNIDVTAESDDILVQDGYVAKDRIGTKIDTPIAKIPQAVSVVTQKQIEDQKPRTLNDALGYTASANPNSFGFDTRYDAFFLRGFQAFYNGMFRDGLRQYNGPSAWFKTEPYGIEGVTILKGPASSLYGISGPGGIVNVVTKRPKDEPFHEIELLAGEHNRFQAALDASGPVNGDGSLLYRFTSLGRLSETDLPAYPDDKLYLAPAFTFKPDEDTKLTILGEYSKSVTGGTAAFYNSAYGVLSNVYEGDPAWNDFSQDQGRLGYEFEHRFNDVLTVRQNLRYDAVDSDIEYSGHYSIGANQPLQRYWGHYTEKMKNFVVDNMAQFEFDTGPIRHTAIAGLDYAWSNYDAGSGVSFVSVEDIESAPVPYYGGQRMNQLGTYLHDQMEWNDFTLFASGRYDWVDTTSTAADSSQSRQKDSAFSGRVGLSYQTEWGITPYVNYSTSFSPNIGFVYDDINSDVSHVARPTIATQKEIGVKYEIPDRNATVSAALFDIHQQDGVVFDASTAINKQRQLDLNSRGFELEGNASLANGFSFIASYTYLRMKIERGAEGTVGKELSATPNHILSLWGHYQFENGALGGLGLGTGLRFAGASYGDDTNTFKNDARAFVDASLSYDFGYRNAKLEGVKLQVNAKNLFDNQQTICSAGYCYRDEGRSLFGSLRYRF
ncbi:TonB-dependent siderophore receptor [Mesorhizobium sp. M3A.F.Ca.ET.174.01.1.1]|uniref:TonB-dependent siderophore receptor n=1 Tax=unclassified Mesorhizobium TaxID=325217 RepID=UPI00109374E1|nr:MULTISPECIES: TonB-dependent siderophore receptor [unclassified Mesorhizobium]TGS85449.1 TonB-dependent siderophore receptor [Mesorhizobium sp. M3A.F.Ca.ET.175.01.1.1]TGT25862.1 TonB-dependent siderophore receptor [Mesorhizobium sp. M3A.F.Ca.ET.174.01.1.1]